MLHHKPHIRLLGRIIPYRKLLLPALFALLIMALAMALLPILIQQILDSSFIQKNQASLQMASLATITLFIVRGIAHSISIYAVEKAGSQLGVDLRADVFTKLLALPISDYRHLNKNTIDTLMADINQITHITTRNIAMLIQDTLTIIGLIICIFYLNQEFSLLLLLVSPLIILIIQMTHGHSNKPGHQEILLASSHLIQHLLQSIRHYREIRLDGGQTHESQRLGKIAEPIYHAEMRQAMIRAAIVPSGQLITTLILVAIIYFMMQQTFNNTLGLDEAGALISAVLLLIIPIQRITSILAQLQQDQTIIEALFSFLDQAHEEDTGTQSMQHICGKLVFEQICFCHDTQTKPILDHINLTIKPSETIVFIHYTDNEKNALIDLILRLRQPTSGNILLDDYPLAEIKLNDLYANIAIVPGDCVLLDEKVAGNIAYGGMRCANEAKITRAAQASHAMEFIRNMPEGLQTKIDKEGGKISKTQSQQIAIARALLKNPALLILDEPSVVNGP
ncbi:MAG: ABC transporter transmembrane domain-containing protein, partial [Pseudomonadota bacterium]